MIDDAAIQRLEKEEVIIPTVLIPCRGASGEKVPSPDTNWVVVFADFFRCGLQFPPSHFFLLVLQYYEIELIHLNPNSFLMLSVFAHLCEVYLGIRPSLELWKFFFTLWRLKATRGDVVGGCGF